MLLEVVSELSLKISRFFQSKAVRESAEGNRHAWARPDRRSGDKVQVANTQVRNAEAKAKAEPTIPNPELA